MVMPNPIAIMHPPQRRSTNVRILIITTYLVTYFNFCLFLFGNCEIIPFVLQQIRSSESKKEKIEAQNFYPFIFMLLQKTKT